MNKLVFYSAWIQEDTIWPYIDAKGRFMLTNRIPKGFKEAVEAIEDVIKTLPQVIQHPSCPSRTFWWQIFCHLAFMPSFHDLVIFPAILFCSILLLLPQLWVKDNIIVPTLIVHTVVVRFPFHSSSVCCTLLYLRSSSCNSYTGMNLGVSETQFQFNIESVHRVCTCSTRKSF